jgi:hypothetical protein
MRFILPCAKELKMLRSCESETRRNFDIIVFDFGIVSNMLKATSNSSAFGLNCRTSFDQSREDIADQRGWSGCVWLRYSWSLHFNHRN